MIFRGYSVVVNTSWKQGQEEDGSIPSSPNFPLRDVSLLNKRKLAERNFSGRQFGVDMTRMVENSIGRSVPVNIGQKTFLNGYKVLGSSGCSSINRGLELAGLLQLSTIISLPTGRVKRGGNPDPVFPPHYLMKVICAWCKKKMGKKPGNGISQGICEKCSDKVEKKLREIK
mgnify:CR=1 FL=1